MATRHLVRTVILQSLYEWDFFDQKRDIVAILERNLEEFAPGIDEPEFAWKILKGVIDHLKQIDQVIIKAAPEWQLEQAPATVTWVWFHFVGVQPVVAWQL